MNFFLEIGYTNTKIVIDKNEELVLLNNYESNLKKFINNFDFVNNKLYILNNNSKFNTLLNSFKSHNNYFLFDNNINDLNLKINPIINSNELGNDLKFLIHYISKLKYENIVLMSDGSCLVTIVKQNNLVNSISINLGLETSLIEINDKYGLSSNKIFFNKYATNTNDSLELGKYLMFNGILKSTLETFSIKDVFIILCGNGYNEEWINSFKEKTKFKFEYIPDLVLKIFRDWCLENLL